MKQHRKIFVDWQPLLLSKSGVGSYIGNLLEALVRIDTTDLFTVSAFSFSLRRYTFQIAQNVRTQIIRLIPRSIYLKFLEHGIQIPVECFTGFYDIYFFGNFINFPHIKGKSVTVIHDLTFLKYPEFMEEKNLAHLSALVPYAVTHADHIVTVSASVKHELIETFAVKEESISVIPPIIDTLTQRTDQHIKKKNYILYIGNIEPRKNLLRLIEAYRMMPMRDTYALIIAGGKGWKCDEILSEIQKPLDRGSIQYLGYVTSEEREKLYNEATVFVFPSIYEGFGMPVLEAAAHGLPVVISKIPSLIEVAGDSGIYIDPLDSRDITRGIEEALCMEQKVKDRYVQKGYERLAYFQSKEQANILLDIFNRLTNENNIH